MAVRVAMLVAMAAGLAAEPTHEALFRSLLTQADTALRDGKPQLAHQLYVQAEGQSEESPAADIGQVRADLLAGEFRRASAFALLVSGEHADSSEALALGAFLEERAGQTDRAVDFLGKALASRPDSAALVGALAEILIDRGRSAQALEILDPWILSHRPQADVLALRARAARVLNRVSGPPAPGARPTDGGWPAPYFEAFPDVAGKCVNGFVIDHGSRVVTLSTAVSNTSRRIFVRNGLGRVRVATLERLDTDSGLATLRLETPYEARSSLSREQFDTPVPGRPASVVGFGVVDRHEASWPALTAGLLVRPRGVGPLRMSADLPESAAGSAVFDPQGRLVGIAVPPLVIPVTDLQTLLKEPPAPSSVVGTPVPAKELVERVQGAVVVVLIPEA